MSEEKVENDWVEKEIRSRCEQTHPIEGQGLAIIGLSMFAIAREIRKNSNDATDILRKAMEACNERRED